jgi:hypothetical protein
VWLIKKMVKTAPAQMANRQTKNATVEYRPNLLNARMRSWNIETPSSGAHKAKHGWKLLAGSPRKSGRGSARTPQRKPSPASPSNCACNRLKKPTLTSRTGAKPYSPNFVLTEFSEVR